MILDSAVLSKLEFSGVLDLFLKETRSEPGILALKNLDTASDIPSLEKRQARVREFDNFRDERGDMPWKEGMISLVPFLKNARQNAFMTGPELVHFKTLFILSQKIRNCFQNLKTKYPELWETVKKIRDFSEEIESLSSLNDDGTLLDSASPLLSRIRNDIFRTRNALRDRANRIMNDPRLSGMLRDRNVTIRNGRYIVTVKQENSSRFPGIIQDRSGSGNSVFMEPNDMIELNHRLAMLLSEEKEEEYRLLSLMTQKILSRSSAVIDTEKSLGLIDMLYAVTSVMRQWNWNLPLLSTKTGFSLKQVIHPLLNVKPVPLDIRCGDDFRILVITGPNTGGKTVALKTAALSVILSWYGLPLPAEESSRVGYFSGLFIDIGDEQSVEQNLSTFSSHIKNLVNMLRSADRNSLLFLDELGAGTDPQEGAALGIAILDSIRNIGCCALATTHHNPIKSFAISEKDIETASMEFDEITLAPTYRMLIGIPGKSNALHIAERLGMPFSIIDRARQALSTRETSIEDIISELEDKKQTLDRVREELEIQKDRNRLMSDRIDKDRKNMELEQERLIEESREIARQIITDAEEKAKDLLNDLHGAALSRGHRAMAEHKKKKNKTPSLNRENSSGINSSPSGEISPGDHVKVVGSRVKGEVTEIIGKKALVQSGPLKIEVPVKSLTVAEKQPHDKEKSEKSINISKPQSVPSSLMIRGMTVTEAVPLVEQYLDRAMRAGHSSVCVIHGRGEGILRREVHRICQNLSYVISYRLGDVSEGGYGVTIVTFRK
jgi:DNA mismatch repair protein MutS2